MVLTTSKSACFASVQFALDTNISVKQKKELKEAITSHGGIISDFITPKVHLLVSEGEGGYKRYTASRLQTQIVSVNYVKTCISSGTLIPATDAWLLQKDNKGKITNESDHFTNGKKRIFDTAVESPRKSESGAPCSMTSDGLVSGFCPAKKKPKPEGPEKEEDLLKKNPGIKFRSKEDLEISFPSHFEIAKVDILHKAEQSGSAFMVLELHMIDKNAVNSLLETDYKFHIRVFVQYGSLKASGVNIQDEKCIYCTSVSEAELMYFYLYNNATTMLGFCKTVWLNFGSIVGSDKLKEDGLQHSVNQKFIATSVSSLVNKLYEAASVGIKTLVDSPIGTISLEIIEKAISVLLRNISGCDIVQLSAEFGGLIPGSNINFAKPGSIESTLEQLQNMADLLQVQESSLSVPEMRYKSMNCNIIELEKSSEEYNQFAARIPKVKNIFKIARTAERDQFTNIGNVKRLFHGTKSGNVFGILSRGFLIPNFQELNKKYGVQRTHATGLLGYGIYFADQFAVSHKYTTESGKSRFILVADVALGSCKEFVAHDTVRVSAPDGYNSVQGVKATPSRTSAFQDDEYVVYNTSQILLKYLIEYGAPDDELELSSHPETGVLKMGADYSPPTIFSEAQFTNEQQEAKNLKIGLVSDSGAELPLKEVSVKAQILDLASEVVVFQKFRNNSDEPIECKYVFELAPGSAVCGFEAFIKNKHIVGKVEEKKQAHEIYEKAVSEGKRAYMLDESEEDANVFTLSVGNVPGKCDVIIKITYVAEVAIEGNNIMFLLPASLAKSTSKLQNGMSEQTQKSVKVVAVDSVDEVKAVIQIGIDMPYKITNIASPNHHIKIKRTETKATIFAEKLDGLKNDFVLSIGLEEIHRPRMWIEKDSTGNQAAVLAFYPVFEYTEVSENEFIFLVDRSNSMKNWHDSVNHTLKNLVEGLPAVCKFNIITFGSYFERFSPISIENTSANRQAALNYLLNAKSNYGSTSVYFPLKSLFLLADPENPPRNIFVLSDGQINNDQAVLGLVRRNSHHTRVFTIGFGNEVNRHTINSLAKIGGGLPEFVKENMFNIKQLREITKRQIKRALQPCLSDIKVEWKVYSHSRIKHLNQAPQIIESLFSGERVLVYAVLTEPCTSATLKAKVQGHEVSTIVYTTELLFTTGKIVHTLAAKAMIKDFSEGMYSEESRIMDEIEKTEKKRSIIDISLKYNLLSQFTSFIAVEDKDDGKPAETPPLEKIIEQVSVDHLQYIPLEKDGYADESSPRASVNDFELLNVIGKGSFGKVMQVRMKEDGKIYAMSVYRKDTINKNVSLTRLKHPYLANTHYTFETEDKFYVISDHFTGGELFYHLHKEGRFDENRAKLYAAELSCALEYLHEHDIIYPDLRPENLMLDSEGHIALTDYWVSKQFSSTGEFGGTPEYLAPEILKGQEPTKSGDWWSLGTILYEMLTGLPPFYCHDVQAMFEKILSAELRFPQYISKYAKSFLTELLTREPRQRLGRNGGKEVQKHPWFEELDFFKLLKKEIEPPFKPQVRSTADCSQIDPVFTCETPASESVLASSFAENNFEGFTYVSESLQNDFANFTYNPNTTPGPPRDSPASDDKKPISSQKEYFPDFTFPATPISDNLETSDGNKGKRGRGGGRGGGGRRGKGRRGGRGGAERNVEIEENVTEGEAISDKSERKSTCTREEEKEVEREEERKEERDGERGAARDVKNIDEVRNVTPPAQPPRQIKFENALAYLDQVKITFAKQPRSYNDFLDIMKEFKTKTVEVPEVISRVQTLFTGQPHLIQGFNTFLPAGYKVETHDEIRDGTPSPGIVAPSQPIQPPAQPTRERVPEFDHSRQYVKKIKTRFQSQPAIYKSFLDILHSYHRDKNTVAQTYAQVANLFIGHEDLLEEFRQFLPLPVPASGDRITPVLESQFADGHWELTDSLLLALEIKLTAEEVTNNVLISSGCLSLGEETFKMAKMMLATSLVVSYVLAKIREGKISAIFMAQIERAREWLAKADESFPMLAYRLDLGLNWESFANNYLAAR